MNLTLSHSLPQWINIILNHLSARALFFSNYGFVIQDTNFDEGTRTFDHHNEETAAHFKQNSVENLILEQVADSPLNLCNMSNFIIETTKTDSSSYL